MTNKDLNLALRMTADPRLLVGGMKQGERGVTEFSRKSQEELRKLNRVSDEVRGHFSDMAGSFAKAAGGLFLASKIKPGIAVAGDLQEAMLGVKTELMGSVEAGLKMDKTLTAISSTAFDIQRYTPFDQAQIVNLEKELIKSGARVSQVVGKNGAAAAAAALAAYEKLDPVATGEDLVAIATPFNVQGDQFMALANQAAAAASASTASFSSIKEGAKYAAGSMAGLGRDTKEMFALLATLDMQGLSGSMGGTSLNAFFSQAVKLDVLKDAKGNLKSTTEIIDILGKRLDGLGTAKRAAVLNKMFGEEGGRAAKVLLTQGDKSYAAIAASMDKAVGLQEKLEERLKGYNAQLDSLKGTAKSTFATLFEPALDPLTKLISKTNEWTGALGEAAQEHKLIGQIGTGVAGAAAVGGLIYGGAHLLKGMKSGGKMLGALKGGTELAGGVAMGKAIEAAAGVPSVFVVNMPDGGPGGPSGTLDTADKLAKTLGGPKVFSKLKTTAALLGGAPLSALPSFGAGAMALSAGAVAGAGAAGYGAGTLINDYLLTNQGPLGSDLGASIGDAIGSAIAHVISPFSEEARAAIAANNKAAEVAGQISIHVTSDGQAKVTQLKTSGGPEMSVYTGKTMAGRG